MMGMNTTITLLQTTSTIDDAGGAEETEVSVITGVPCAFQPHNLNNLPPPSDQQGAPGIRYYREFRCWLPFYALGNIVPRIEWILINEQTDERFRITAVIDESGRHHHYLIRMENFDGS